MSRLNVVTRPEDYDDRLKAFMISVEGEKLPVYVDTKGRYPLPQRRRSHAVTTQYSEAMITTICWGTVDNGELPGYGNDYLDGGAGNGTYGLVIRSYDQDKVLLRNSGCKPAPAEITPPEEF
jgi:hypothetical protein